MNHNKCLGYFLSLVIALVFFAFTKELFPSILLAFWCCYYVMDAVE